MAGGRYLFVFIPSLYKLEGGGIMNVIIDINLTLIFVVTIYFIYYLKKIANQQ